MKHANEMDSGSVIYVPSFIEMGCLIQNFIRLADRRKAW
jgi:hypothetical protein